MAEISSTGDQMLHLLEIVAFEGPRSTAELAAAAGINRTVAHRLLSTLHGRGYLGRQGRAHVLGPVLAQIAAMSDLEGMVRLAEPVMRDLALALGESVVLHRVDGDMAVVVGQAVAEEQLVRVQHREGSRHPLSVGASGRALLASQPARFVQRIVAHAEAPEALGAQLSRIRAQGYALSENELQQGVVGAAVPLAEADGAVRFSLAVLMPSHRAERLAVALPALLDAGRRIEAQVGQAGG